MTSISALTSGPESAGPVVLVDAFEADGAATSEPPPCCSSASSRSTATR